MTLSMINEIKSIDEKNVPPGLIAGFLAGKKDTLSDVEYSLKERERKKDNPEFKLKNELQNTGNRIESSLSKP